MELMAKVVTEYLESLVPERPEAMQAMETHAQETNFPIIGPAAGQFCYVVARLAGARRVFELGSGFGYSTAWFARAVRENGGGEVHHVVWDESRTAEAREWLGKLGYADTVRYHTGEAVAALRGAEGRFDLIFNDIDKQGYAEAVGVAAERLRPGGVLIVDNALWHGRIFDGSDRTEATEGVRAMTRLLADEAVWASSLVPIRDGLMVAMRR
jgi:predicted O-methyltransferase YrrM